MTYSFRTPFFSAAALAMAVASAPALAADPKAAFTLPDLPYATDALAPAIDKETMELHHGKHHKAYVDNLNKRIADYPKLGEQSIEAVMANIGDYDVAVRNNGGGHYNHSLFWTILAPEGKQGEPSQALSARISKDFESKDKMVKAFNDAAAANFGSGWTWVVVKDNGELAITNTPNQDNPLMSDAKEKGTPLFGLDTWEHAYYLQYQNRRPEYINAFWKVLNWNEVNKRYDAAKK